MEPALPVNKPLGCINLFLRRVIHPQAHDNYRVILKVDTEEFEIGSIGVQHGSAGAVFWAWGIDTVVPMRDVGAQGRGQDREDCMKLFREAWERFCSDPKRLEHFLAQKRKRMPQ